MTQYFFTIPALNPGPAQEELNRFCLAHRVSGLDRQFVANGDNSYWAFCVTLAAEAEPLPDVLKAPERRSGVRNATAGAGRVDYRDVLSERDFSLYAELRKLRKTIAEAEGAPVYTVFTNEQLAEIVRRRVCTLADLGAIDGVGPARLERYGAKVLACLGACLAALAAAE